MSDAAREDRDDPAGSDHVVGRDRALGVVERFLAGLTRPGVLVIRGGPGIGKTTVLGEVRRMAAARGVTVLSCRPDPAEVTLAFGGLVDLFDGVPSDRFADLPVAQRTDLDVALRRRPPETGLPDPLAVSAGARAALDVLATSAPVLVTIDDAHWLDASTGAIVAYVLRRLDTERIGVVIARRSEDAVGEGPASDPGPSAALESASAVPVEWLDLEPLSLSAMHHIIRSRTGQVLPRPLLHRVTDASAGNPLLAIALVSSMIEDGRRPGAGEPLVAPVTLLEHTARRVARLPAATRETLLVVASLSPPSEDIVAAVLGHDPGPALEAARDAGILDHRADPLRFAHPLYAECVVRLASAGRRRAVHRRIAELIDEPEGRARHLALTADPPDDAIAASLEAGAAAARARGGLRAAAELLTLATTFTSSLDPATAHRRAFEAAATSILIGDRIAARGSLAELVDAAEPPLRQRAAGLFAELVASDGDIDAAQRILHAARATVTEPATRTRIELDLAYTSLLRPAPAAAVGFAASARTAASAAGDPALLAESLAYEALSRLLAGLDPDDGAIAEALRLEDTSRPPYMGLPASGVIGLVHAFAGRHDTARALLGSANVHLDALGDDADLAHVLLWSSWLEMRSGRLSEATTLARQAATMAETTGSEILRTWSVAQAALVEAYRGVGAATDARLAEAVRTPSQVGGIVAAWSAAAAGLARSVEGDWRAAADAYRPILTGSSVEPLAEPVLAFFVPDAVEAFAASGDPTTAAAVLEPFAAAARTRDRPWAIAVAHRAAAAIAAARGRSDLAALELQAALACHDVSDLPLEHARTALALGRVERRLGERRAARSHLADAERRFELAGAIGWARLARAEAGRVPGVRVVTGELTPGEQRVAKLSGAGRTNREVAATLFLSPKTVEANLARIYRKLGISTRAELGAWLAGTLDRDDPAAT